jgi:transposase-like protein
MAPRSGETDDDRRCRAERVIALSARGVPVAQIAEEVGVSTTHVFRIRAALMKPGTRPRRFTDDELAFAERMLEDGASINEVARTLGRHPGTVGKKFRGRGWSQLQSAEWGALMYTLRHSGRI